MKMKNLQENKDHLRSYRDHIIDEKREANGEVFTPTTLVQQILDQFPESEFKDPTRTWIDHCCGNGQFLSEILIRKLENNHSLEQALSTVYGVEVCEENVKECRERLLCGREDLRYIVERNIVWHDALTYDYSFNGSNKNKQDAHFDNLFEIP
jgi:type I restriction-modification system DNA methylase subunit